MYSLTRQTVLSPDCSRGSGLKSSLNRVHLKIYHALKVTSHLSEGARLNYSQGIATNILINFRELFRCKTPLQKADSP